MWKVGIVLLCCGSVNVSAETEGNEQAMVLASPQGVEALFTVSQNDILWMGLHDTQAGRRWNVAGPRFSVQT
jgi:hypothetical protein